MITTIIFDMADTQVTLEDDEFCKAVSKKFDIFFDKVMAAYEKQVWENEYGRITEEELYRNMYDVLGIKHDDKLIEWSKKIRIDFRYPIPGMKELIEKLKDKKYRLGIASNDGLEPAKRTVNVFGLSKLFDFIFLAPMAGYRKNHKEFYEEMIRQNNLNPKECIYIDDGKKYVEMAKEFGFTGIHFKDAKQLEEELKRLGIKV